MEQMKCIMKHIMVYCCALVSLSACYSVDNVCEAGESDLINLTVKADWSSLEESCKAGAKAYFSFYCKEKFECEVNCEGSEYTRIFSPDVYRVMLLNQNHENVRLQNLGQFDNATASVVMAGTVRSGEVLALTPSNLYGATISELVLEGGMGNHTVTMTAGSYLKQILFNVTIDCDVEITSVGGVLTGAAQSINLCTRQTLIETVNHEYELVHDTGDLWTGNISILGLSSDAANRNILTVGVVLGNGEVVEQSEDITDKLRAALTNSTQVTLDIKIQITNTPIGFVMAIVSWTTDSTGGGTVQ